MHSILAAVAVDYIIQMHELLWVMRLNERTLNASLQTFIGLPKMQLITLKGEKYIYIYIDLRGNNLISLLTGP